MQANPHAVAGRLALRAGELELALQDGCLIDLFHAGVEVWRSVMFLYRDPAWATPRHVADLRKAEVRDDGFALQVAGSCPDVPSIRWLTGIQGTTDGQVRFSVDIAVDADLLTSRTGICVLHPASVAGAPLEVEHVDGRITRSCFPERIAAWQPFTQIRALRHRFAPGGWAICRFDGDDYEMEDQRNFSDASFKTYSRSNFAPRPFRLDAGARLQRSVTLTLDRVPRRKRRLSTDATVAVGVSAESTGHLPALGLLASAENTVAGVRAPAFSHLRLDLRQWSPAATLDLLATRTVLSGTGTPLRVDLILADDADAVEACRQLAAACVAHSAVVSALAIFPTSARALRAARACFPHARIGGGTPFFFTQLNRLALPPQLDFVTYTTCPIIHVADDLSVMQSLATLQEQVTSLRARGVDAPVHVGPVGIGMSMDPFGVQVRSEPRSPVAMARDDARDHAVFGQAWMLGYLSRMTAAGIASVTLAHADVLDALNALAARRGAPVCRVRNPDPDRVAVLALDDGRSCQAWVANLSLQSLDIRLALPRTKRPHMLHLTPGSWVCTTS